MNCALNYAFRSSGLENNDSVCIIRQIRFIFFYFLLRNDISSDKKSLIKVYFSVIQLFMVSKNEYKYLLSIITCLSDFLHYLSDEAMVE